MNKRRIVLALGLAVALAFGGVVLAEGTSSLPVSNGGVTPYIIDGENEGGNRTCAEVGLASFGDAGYYRYSTARWDRNDFVGEMWYPGWPDGFWFRTDGTYVEWMSPISNDLAVIVKGGNAANVYVYNGAWNDSGLASPLVGPEGKQHPAELSNLTFCWNPCHECEWIGETAWAANDNTPGERRYTNRGNWATYVTYSSAAKTTTLFAGQTMRAGTVGFSAPVNGEVTITISLNEGWRLAEGKTERVKIQGYNTAPSGNPAPGLFTTYKGDELTVTVPALNFYGIHLDVEWEKCD